MKKDTKILLALLAFGAIVYWKRQQIADVGGDIIMTVANTLSNAGENFIKRLEGGFKSKAYPDAGGFSIGWGHYLGSRKTVDNITEAQAQTYFDNDIEQARNIITRYVKVPLTQGQYDALVSFLYNLGPAGFIRKDNGRPTSVLAALNNGDYTGAANAMALYNKAQGVVVPYLVERRRQEIELFNS